MCASPKNLTWSPDHSPHERVESGDDSPHERVESGDDSRHERVESGDETSTVYAVNHDVSSRLKCYWPKGILRSV